jgi:drug/metabolite transporter (DMT)-like permease
MCTTEPPKEGTPLKGQSVSRLVRLADDARLVVAVAVVLYVISGICQPLGVDYLKYQGFMGSKDPSVPSTHIGVLLNTLGMAGVGAVFLLRHPWPQLSQVQYRNMLIVCAIDLVSQALVMYGQLKVGGGLYVVLYSSCTVWTAILSRILLHKQLTFQQWLAVLEVTAGLILSNLNVMLSTSSAGPGATSMVEILTGSLVLLLGSIFHSLTFVATEWLLAGQQDGVEIAPMALAGFMGSISSGVLLLYNAGLTATYGFSTMYLEPVEATGGSWGKVAFGLPCLLIANMVHSGAFFCMLGSLGAVVAGIMKGLQAVAVFILSATIYCSIEETQCVVFFVDGKYGPGLLKTFAMYMVVRGVFAYSVAPKAEALAPPPDVVPGPMESGDPSTDKKYQSL